MAESSNGLSGSSDSWIGRGSQALQRGIGVLGAAAIGIAGIGLSSSGMLPFSQMAGQWPGGNLVFIILVGLGACLLLGTSLSVIAAAVPRAGSDYFLTSRVLGRPVAFLSSWLLVIFCGLLAGALLATFLKDLMPVFNQIAVMIFGQNGSADLIKLANQPQVLILLGTMIVFVAFLGLFIPQRVLLRLLGGGFVLGLLAWVVMILAFNASSTDLYQIAWNQARGADSFVQVIPSAEKFGFQLVNDPLGFIVPGLMVGLWFFFGFLSTFSLAGEVRKPEKALLAGNWLALIVAAGVFCAGLAIVQRVLPSDWLAAESYLSQVNGYSGTTLPSITAYAGLIISSVPLMLLIFWCWLLSFVTLIQVFILWISRMMLAWADDNLLPAGMAYVHPRFRSPLVTLLSAAIWVLIGFVIFQAGGFKATLANVDFFTALALLAPVTALTLFPFMRKAWFEECPLFVRRKIGPLPWITLSGLVSMAYLIFLLAAPWLMPGRVKPVEWPDLLVLGIILIVGLAWYVARWLNLRAKGIRMGDEIKGEPHLI